MTDEYSPQSQNEEDEDYLPEEVDPSYADYAGDEDERSLKDKAVDTTIDVGKEVAKHEVKKAGKKAVKEVAKKSAEGLAEAAGAETAGIGFLVALAIEAIDRLAQHLKEALKKLKEKRKKIYMMQLATCLTIFMFPVLVGGLVLITYQKDQAVASEIASTICLDPGHPSENEGAPGEYQLNFKVATELKTALEQKGYKIVMTKNSVSEKVLNKERADICAAGNSALMYRIHANEAGGKKGPFHEYPDPALSNISETSKKYADIIHKKLTDTLNITGKTSGSQPVDGGVCTELACSSKILEGSKQANSKNLPAVLIEMIRLDSQGNTWIADDGNRATFVKGVAEGIAAAIPVGTTGASGDAIVKQAIYYRDHPDEYRKDAIKDFTDCAGFVETIFWKLNIDPAFVEYGRGHRAKELINYFRAHQDKYQIVSENVSDTSVLKPGDVLLRYEGGSHAAIYVGPIGDYNKIQASIGSHGPENGNWYSSLHVAVRLK